MKTLEHLIIVDFGGQYAHLIASRVRRLGFYTEIVAPEECTLAVVQQAAVRGVILSGGPQSVFDAASPSVDVAVLRCGKPILGICYGHQFLASRLGGEVRPAAETDSREYGPAALCQRGESPLWQGVEDKSTMWMSHGDAVTKLPEGFVVIAESADCPVTAMADEARKLYGIQFHPEVTHSTHGQAVLRNFVEMCEITPNWGTEQFLAQQREVIAEQIGDRRVLLFVSGGVDSSVCLALLTQTLGGDRVKGVFVDTGLLRAGEREQVEASLRGVGADLTVIDAGEMFLSALGGQTDPEEKRKTIGRLFLEVQREYFADKPLGDGWVLGQGTIYPDTIETGGTKHADTIKTHHNRVTEVQALIDQGLVIEPIAPLYKDEVRQLGEALGLPKAMVWRHPFPGPGLGVRILCSGEAKTETLVWENGGAVLPLKSVGVQGDFRTYSHPLLLETANENIAELEAEAVGRINKNGAINRVTVWLAGRTADTPTVAELRRVDINPGRVATLQAADGIVTRQLLERGIYNDVWQFPVVLAPVSFAGGGTETVILRPVDSIDAMSAGVGRLDYAVLRAMADEIIMQVPQVSAVLLDVTPKPPGTIEWE